MSNVTVYTKPMCQNCDKTKRLMNTLGVEYDEINIMEDDAALQKILDLGYKAAPVVIAGEESWSGFNEGKIRSIAVSDDDNDWDF